MLGRTMSIFMVVLMGLAPLAFALAPMRVMNDPKSATIPESPPAT